MPANKFSGNLTANTLQLLINQVFGLVIFYVLSRRLDKNIFGQLNWCLAVLLAAFSVLCFGIDQVMVKKLQVAIAVSPFSMLTSFTLLSAAFYFMRYWPYYIFLNGIEFLTCIFSC